MIFALSLGLSAQAISYLNMGQWIDGKYAMGYQNRNGFTTIDFKEKLVCWEDTPYAPLPKGQLHPEGVNRITFDGDTIQRPKLFSSYIGQSKVFFTDNAYFSTVWGGEPSAMQLLHNNNGVWQAVCELDTKSQGTILPLRNGRFLVGLREGHQVNEDLHDFNPFGIYRMGAKGKLHLVEIIDLGSELKNMNISLVATDLAGNIESVAITEDHYSYINPAVGTIWTFSKSNGRLTRSKIIYPELIDVIKSNKRIVPPITWAQPTADNEILISAWSSKLSIEGGDLMLQYDKLSNNKLSPMPIEDMVKQTEKLQNEIIAIDPIVKWYRYNPATGAVIKEPYGPQGAKDIVESRNDYLKYRTWCPNNDGTEMYYVDVNRLYIVKPGEKFEFSEITWNFSTDSASKSI